MGFHSLFALWCGGGAATGVLAEPPAAGFGSLAAFWCGGGGATTGGVVDPPLPAIEKATPGYLLVETIRAGYRSTNLGSNPAFSTKDPEEVVVIGWDFGMLTLAASNPSAEVERHSGAEDTSPSAMLLGPPVIVGTRLLQRVGAGVDRCQYAVRFEIDDADGNHYAREGVLPVRAS